MILNCLELEHIQIDQTDADKASAVWRIKETQIFNLTYHFRQVMQKYNQDRYNAIDGKALKQCDKLSAFIEASLSISHGIKSKELLQGKKQIMSTLEEIQGVDFKSIAQKIDEEFCTTGITQTRMEL